MKTCNNCIYAPCCHYLLQEERGYDEHSEAYYNDMEERCGDFQDKENYTLIDKTLLSKKRRKIMGEIKCFESRLEVLQRNESVLSLKGHQTLGYVTGCISCLKAELNTLDEIFPLLKKEKKGEEE